VCVRERDTKLREGDKDRGAYRGARSIHTRTHMARSIHIRTHIQGGISGGEKKRTAIGMELITNPSILFLDEPTTGLDTYTAYSVMHTLHSLATAGRTGLSLSICLVKV